MKKTVPTGAVDSPVHPPDADRVRSGAWMPLRLVVTAACLLAVASAAWGWRKIQRPARPTRPAAAEQHRAPRLMVQSGHSDPVTSVAFSPDGRYALTGSWDHTARLWEVGTGKEIRDFIGHSDLVNAVCFSPNGRYVLTGSEDKTARLWEADTGKEIRRFIGHSEPVASVAFSPDGRYVLTGSEDKTARLWEANTGKEIQRFVGSIEPINSVCLSPGGRYLLTGSGDKLRSPTSDNTGRLWDVRTGKEIQRFVGHTAPIASAVFSSDGRYVLTGGEDGTTRLWDAGAGKEIRRFKGDTACFSPDGRYVFTGNRDDNGISARLWETDTGKEIRRFKGHTDPILSVAFSPDGRSALTGSGDTFHPLDDNSGRLWDVNTGKELRRFVGRSVGVYSVKISPDGRYVLIDGNQTAYLWDVKAGKEIRRFEGHDACFSPNSRYVFAATTDETACMWEIATGKKVHSFPSGLILSTNFSPDGRYAITGGYDGTARMWDVRTGKEIRRFLGGVSDISFVSCSPDGRYLLTAGENTIPVQGEDGAAHLWQVSNGKEIRRFEGASAHFSPDGRSVLTVGDDHKIHLWEIKTGKERQRFAGRFATIGSFSPDGRYMLAVGDDDRAVLCEIKTGKAIRHFTGRLSTLVNFSPDGRYVLAGAPDGGAHIWNAVTGQELCSLNSFTDGTWAVADPHGRYDGSNSGEVEGLHWVIPNRSLGESLALSQLRARYYDPHLLAKALDRFRDPRGRLVPPRSDIKEFAALDPNQLLTPQVDMQLPAPGSTSLTLRLTNRGGGIGPVLVRLNGKPLLADARGPHPDPQAETALLKVDLANASLAPDGRNDLEVIPYTRDAVAGAGTHRLWTTAHHAAHAPALYAVLSGIDVYSGGSVQNLAYPAHDAQQMAQALGLAGANLLGKGKVHLFLLTDAAPSASLLGQLRSQGCSVEVLPPDKPHFLKVFQSVAHDARPEDLLVLFLAGHGTAYHDAASPGVVQDVYAYLTKEAATYDLSDPAVRARCSLSSQEVSEWTDSRHIKALKQVLILDTCYAGAAAMQLALRRSDGDEASHGTQALAELRSRNGVFVLLGCAGDAASYETSEYGEGLLTYALLAGMKGEQLGAADLVDVGPLLDYASKKTSELAGEVGNVQEPQVMRPADVSGEATGQTASYPIGRMTEEAKRSIVLPEPRPIVARPSFLNEASHEDDLELSEQTAHLLEQQRYVAGRGGGGVVYLDVSPRTRPGAIAVSGGYTRSGSSVTVHLVLRLGAHRQAATIRGTSRDIMGKLVTAIQQSSITLHRSTGSLPGSKS